MPNAIRAAVFPADNATAEHIVLSNYEWCGGATLTVVRFTYKSVRHVARRFWRRDIGTSGVEIYTVDPDCAHDSVVGEWPRRYARTDGGTFLDRLATRLIGEARQAFDISPDISERAALIEWAA